MTLAATNAKPRSGVDPSVRVASAIMVLVGAALAVAALTWTAHAAVAAARGGFGGTLVMFALPVMTIPGVYGLALVTAGRRARRGEDLPTAIVFAIATAAGATSIALNPQWFEPRLTFRITRCADEVCFFNHDASATSDFGPEAGLALLGVLTFVAVACVVTRSALRASPGASRIAIAVLTGTILWSTATLWAATNAERSDADARSACELYLAIVEGELSIDESIRGARPRTHPRCESPDRVAREASQADRDDDASGCVAAR
jgi:hypothetical protein